MFFVSRPWCLLALIIGAAPLPTPATEPADDASLRLVLVPHAGAAPEDVEIQRAQQRVRALGSRADSLGRLGWAYVAKARRTSDAGYYKLAEKTADAMDERLGAGAGSQLLRGHVLHQLHRFREAEVVARELTVERGLAFDWALLSDVLMEQGKVDEAVAACQQAVNLRPGLEASARIAHLRWLKGDLAGAIAAMDDAARAGSPRAAETQAWVLARLAGYYLQAGYAEQAAAAADAALGGAPDYAPALLARGKVLAALGQLEAAAAALRRAEELNPLPEYQWWLADVLRAAGRAAEAAKFEARIVDRGEAADPRTCALFLATRGWKSSTAVRLARDELAVRADGFTHDALAWALAASGDYAQADLVMQVVTAAPTKDARLALHAGEIAWARDRRDDARKFFAEAQAFAAALMPSERALLARRTAVSEPQAQAAAFLVQEKTVHP